MGRRPDPARIAAAQRAGLRGRLIDEGVRETEVDRWLDAWATDNDGQFERDLAHDWIMGQVALGAKPAPAGPTKDAEFPAAPVPTGVSPD
jgi:hypothetical protein